MDKLIEKHSSYNPKQLMEHKVENLKIFSYPELHKLPTWYKKKIASTIIEIFKTWKEQANAELKMFYIRLHIHSNNIFNSEIILTIEEQTEWYKKRFQNGISGSPLPLWVRLKVETHDWMAFHLHSTWLEEEINTLSSADKNALLQNLVETKNAHHYDGTLMNEYIVYEETVYFLESEKLGVGGQAR